MSRMYQHFTRLFKKYTAGRATEAEKLFVEQYFDYFEDNYPGIVNQLTDEDKKDTEARMRERIDEKITTPSVAPVRFLWKKLSVAAAVLLLLGASVFLLVHKSDIPSKKSLAYKDIAPAKTGAVLTLANGKTIVLDDMGNGLVSKGVVKQDSSLNYQASALAGTNTLVTPRGRTFHVVLSDGTGVWLNAGSSITYPVSFSGKKERVVEMSGECYFEVKHNPLQPFRVKANGELIEDIGTNFNVNAYQENIAVKTTLLQGVVKIRNVVLAPGEQYVNGKVDMVDTDKVMAWKNGLFSFDNVGIADVMKQLERWYDISIEFEGEVSQEKFSGEINRNISLNSLIKELERPGLHFQYKGNREIIIQP